MNIIDLKKICKLNYIEDYSKINKNNKNEFIKHLNESSCAIKIQRWIRKKFIKDEKCPISLEQIKYPCYAFKTNRILIYYDLYTLKNYLIDTGKFVDPLSRLVFTEKQLADIDKIDKHYRSFKKNNTEYMSVLSYSKKDKYYEKKKKVQDDILLKERILDLLCQDIIRLLVSNTNIYNVYNSLESIYLNNYEKNIISLKHKDENHAIYMIDKNINNLLCIVEEIHDSKKVLYEYIIDFMHNIKHELSVNNKKPPNCK